MIRGHKRPLAKATEVKANLNCSIHNRFDIEVVDAATGNVKQRAYAENVVCNALWTRLLAPNTYFNYIHYGTGSGTPAAANTSLFTFLGYGTPAPADDVFTYDWDNKWVSLRRKIQLSESTAVGSTLTEVGIGYSTTAATLCTHAMLKDMNGNQISIAKTSTDIINIYATVFVHWSAFDGGFIDVVHCRVQKYNAYYYGLLSYLLGIYYNSTYNGISGVSYTAGGIAGYPSRTLQNVSVAATPTFSAAEKKITITAARLAAGDGNLSPGIETVHVCASSAGAIVLKVGGSWYSGTTITGEAIGTGDGSTKDYATDFPFVSAATIYADGVAVSGVTVDIDKPLAIATMGIYFDLDEYEATSGDYAYPYGLDYSGAQLNQSDLAWTTITYYNPYYSLGITSFYKPTAGYAIDVSNDKSTWVTIAASATTGTINVNALYQNYKYWRMTYVSGTSHYVPRTFTTAGAAATNIHFATAPASGAVITADYTTKTIAKDANHVFDLTVVITLGEKTT